MVDIIDLTLHLWNLYSSGRQEKKDETGQFYLICKLNIIFDPLVSLLMKNLGVMF